MIRSIKHVPFVAFMTIGWSLVVIPAASAYIDPGSGSMIFQAVIAGAMAVGMGLKVFWRRIVGLFKPRQEIGSRDEG